MVPRLTSENRSVAPRLTPIDKAAIIVMALGNERSLPLLAGLTEDEIRKLGASTAALGRIDADMVHTVVGEFTAQMGRMQDLTGGLEAAEKLLQLSFPPERVAELMDEIKGSHGSNIWDRLAHRQPPMLAAYLRNEHPQTAAVVLAKLPPNTAASVLKLLPGRLSAEIILRVVRMKNIQRSAMADIEDSLRRDFTAEQSRKSERDSTSIVAEMLNRSDPETAERLLAELDQHEPRAAARVRRNMFTFEDLRRVDPMTFGALIAECPAERLPIALKHASEPLQVLFLSSMSERAKKLLVEEMTTMGTTRRKVIEEAQAEITAIAQRLSAEGRITIMDPEDEFDDEEE